jgi:hypothetical protein
MVHGKRIERNNSRLGEHAEVSVKICERLPDLSELNQFVANESRTVDILHQLWPAGAALHLCKAMVGMPDLPADIFTRP